jgi:hypothetical protein
MTRNLFHSAGLIRTNDDSKESHEELQQCIISIGMHKDSFIKDYLSKDNELKEFLAIHGDDSVSKYVPKVLQGLKNKSAYIPKNETMIWEIIKIFDGKPVKYEQYPIKIKLDDWFVVADLAFEEKLINRMEEWRNAPVYVL